MKLNADKIKEAAAWVEKNGLHPQPCGATLRSFCEAMGIDQRTYYRWSKSAVFADALTRAREQFRVNTVREVENALVKAARGVDVVHIKEEKKAQRVVEFDENGRKVKEYDGPPVIVKSVRETVYFPPDVKAAQFVLTNLAGEDWKQKQEQTIKTEKPVIVVRSEEERHKLQHIADGE